MDNEIAVQVLGLLNDIRALLRGETKVTVTQAKGTYQDTTTIRVERA